MNLTHAPFHCPVTCCFLSLPGSSLSLGSAQGRSPHKTGNIFCEVCFHVRGRCCACQHLDPEMKRGRQIDQVNRQARCIIWKVNSGRRGYSNSSLYYFGAARASIRLRVEGSQTEGLQRGDQTHFSCCPRPKPSSSDLHPRDPQRHSDWNQSLLY